MGRKQTSIFPGRVCVVISSLTCSKLVLHRSLGIRIRGFFFSSPSLSHLLFIPRKQECPCRREPPEGREVTSGHDPVSSGIRLTRRFSRLYLALREEMKQRVIHWPISLSLTSTGVITESFGSADEKSERSFGSEIVCFFSSTVIDNTKHFITPEMFFFFCTQDS